MTEPFRVVFMGTPDFAVPALKALHERRHDVVCVVTQPDRRKGRGRKMLPPPVKAAALDFGYDVIQPVSMTPDDVFDALQALKPDVFVVVAFGHILNKKLLALPDRGAVNIHASLLPKYRGPAPIQRAVIDGETETGVTTMMLDEGMDTGDILLTARTPISKEDTAQTLHDRLADMGADLLIQTLDGLADNTVNPVPQDHARATYAPMLKKEDGRMDWTRSAEALDAFIRGMTPWPGAFTFLEDRRIKIFRAVPLDQDAEAPPGTVVRGFADELRVAAGRGVLSIRELQIASAKRLHVRDFLKGCPMPPGTVLG